ncbi:MAG: alpha/beta hydrolase family protein [Acidobacteriota bacterium]
MKTLSVSSTILIAAFLTLVTGSVMGQELRRITYNNVGVDVVIDRPGNRLVDVIIAFHGTVATDDNIIPAAQNMLTKVKEITDRTDVMIVSVAYPQENRLFGDGIREAEAALLWVKEKSWKELRRKVRKIFLVGHSQGGYMVTRLATMHTTDGVIANGPGPLNLVFRCGLEESGQVVQGAVCTLLRQTYGTTAANPSAYMACSLLSFNGGYKSDILFVQGMQDSPIQMYSWPTFKQQVSDRTNCRGRQFLEVANGIHTALFDTAEARTAYNSFINR